MPPFCVVLVTFIYFIVGRYTSHTIYHCNHFKVQLSGITFIHIVAAIPTICLWKLLIHHKLKL